MSKEALHTSWDAIPPEPMNPLLTRQFVHGEQAMIARICLKKGGTVPRHSHPNEQIAYIVSGTIDFHIEDTVHRLGAGGLLVVPPNARHWGVVVGEEPVLNLDVFTPKRAEYAA